MQCIDYFYVDTHVACGTVTGSISTGQCYTYAGSKETCTLSGVSYEFFKINYGSSGVSDFYYHTVKQFYSHINELERC
jgi:hypothetical protein